MTRSPRVDGAPDPRDQAVGVGQQARVVQAVGGGTEERAIAAGSAMPRRARTVAANVPRPSSRAAARTSGSRWSGSGNTQR